MTSVEKQAERAAVAAILIALVAFALIRVQYVDVPWHLATARLARAIGHWPTRNTFSYTFPDHPLYPQYPAFQATLYAVYRLWGWAGLSVLSCAGWAAVFLMFVRWAGPFRAARPFHLLWMLGLYALQRRMVLRPDLFTMLALGAMLLAMDAYGPGRRRWAIVAVPLIHLFWAASHQVFPISFAVQALFAASLALTRRAPLGPALAALGASVGLSFLTPLGLGVFHATVAVARSLALMRDAVQEFAPIWQRPYELALAVLTGAPAAALLARSVARAETRRETTFDAGLWLLSLAITLSAVRGLVFFGIVSVAVAQRAALRVATAAAATPARTTATARPPAVRPSLARLLRGAGTVLTLVLAANVVVHRWVRPPLALGGTQPGVGRCLGGWADGATAFVRANPPPGRMLNMTWVSGNALLWELPALPVFVDPRFEAYPHWFLRAVVDAYADDAKLAALVARHQPTWIYAEHFHDDVRARVVALLGRGWTPVYVDSDHLILVRDVPETAAYRAAHAVDLARAQPADLLPGPPVLRAQQRARFARLMQALGHEERAAEQRAAAAREAGQAGLEAFDPS